MIKSLTRLLGAGISLLAATTAALADVNSPWGADYFTNLPVVTQDGKTLRFYDDVLKNKLVVVSFIYTSCPDICPLTTARLALVKDQLGKAVGRDVFFVSMSVDPENDTPERMKAMAEAFDAGPGWLFLTGKPEHIRTINARFGNTSPVLSQHKYEIVLGNAKTGDWQRDSPFGEIASIVYNIRGMSQTRLEGGIPWDNVPEGGAVALSQAPGETLFRKLCTPCHTIGVGNRVGPDLRDVTSRRTHDWLTAFLSSPGRMRKSGDPLALELDEAFPGVRMPELGLSPNDVGDLIAYMKSATERLAPPQAMTTAIEPHDHATHSHTSGAPPSEQ